MDRIGCSRTVGFFPFLAHSVLFLGAGLASALRADTVALWKLDYEADGSALNARCLLDPANDLLLCGSAWSGSAVSGWSALPPNPDTTGGFLASPTNLTAVGLSPSKNCLTNTAVSARVNVTNSFTVEGWVNRAGNPSGTDWHYLAGNHMGGAGRWILSLRNGGTNWVLYVDGQIIDKAFPVKNDPASTNVWRHIALTYDREAGSTRQGVWELFVDAQSCGALTNASRPATLTPSDAVFSLGGRPNGNTGTLRLDYWRVSDTALATDAFLNAGTAAPATEAMPRTVAYWRLDSAADGTLDARDFIGTAHLASGLDVTNHTTTLRASVAQAFDGQPPNSALSLPGGNAGSVYAQAAGACLRVAGLGRELEVTNSFTVEGWLCPRRQEYDADIQYIANTRIATKGWAFALKKQSNGTRQFVIFAEDDAGTLASDAPLSGDLTDWAEVWKHVALVYDAGAGDQAQGVWRCYLDGVLQAAATNTHVRSGTTASEYFHLSGRVGNGNSFCGFLDCWRACKTALAPNQFLNATDGATPAAGVLALWPLDSAEGLYFDATDATGSWSFSPPLPSRYQVTAKADHPAIANPDTSAAFQGDPATNTGSLVFNTPSASAASSYLATADLTLRETLCYTNSFTWEAWFCRTQNPGNWQLLFGAASSPSLTTGGMSLNFSYRSNGYVLYAGGATLVNDVAFGGTTDDKTLNVWRHVALVYNVSIGKGTWSLYVDGVLQGTLENSLTPSRSVPACLYIGGRPWSANTFIGAIDSARLTKGVLTPGQFLNAQGAPPALPAPSTVAYWKLDSDGTGLNASSQVEPRYSFLPDVYAPTGSTAQFKRLIPVPDTSTNFIGDARANAGSAAFSADYLRVQNLGNRAELDRAFTVEGWMFWSGGADGQVQTLAGTRFDTDYGWRLTLEKNGASAAFRLFCRTPFQTPVADADFPFDAAGLAGGWHHLALTFTPRLSDTGAWTLFVDGAAVGAVANRFYPAALHQSHWFTLGGRAGGADAFNGLLDSWRVSEGARTPCQFLYLGYDTGTFIRLL